MGDCKQPGVGEENQTKPCSQGQTLGTAWRSTQPLRANTGPQGLALSPAAQHGQWELPWVMPGCAEPLVTPLFAEPPVTPVSWTLCDIPAWVMPEAGKVSPGMVTRLSCCSGCQGRAEAGNLASCWAQAASTDSQMHPQPHICSHTGTSTVSATVRARGRWSRVLRVGANTVLGWALGAKHHSGRAAALWPSSPSCRVLLLSTLILIFPQSLVSSPAVGASPKWCSDKAGSGSCWASFPGCDTHPNSQGT